MDKVFHIDSIEKLCIKYRLRFLDTHLFKGDYPNELYSIIPELEATHETKLENFKIMAPSKLFRLKTKEDPLLFVPIGNGYYYLIHKWGNDLKTYRNKLLPKLYGALIKNEQDIELFEKLAFMSRGNG